MFTKQQAENQKGYNICQKKNNNIALCAKLSPIKNITLFIFKISSFY